MNYITELIDEIVKQRAAKVAAYFEPFLIQAGWGYFPITPEALATEGVELNIDVSSRETTYTLIQNGVEIAPPLTLSTNVRQTA